MRKSTFCICENKDADQLRGNREADQRLCFRYIASTIPLLPKYKIASLWPSSLAAQPGLCQTWSETTLLVFSCCGSFVEDQIFHFVNDHSGTLATHRVSIEKYDNIKLRVKTCGHAVIVLYREPGQLAGSVILTVMTGKILVTQCNPNCTAGGTYTDDEYNVGKNCRGNT